jgi:hypothetical protein
LEQNNEVVFSLEPPLYLPKCYQSSYANLQRVENQSDAKSITVCFLDLLSIKGTLIKMDLHGINGNKKQL